MLHSNNNHNQGYKAHQLNYEYAWNLSKWDEFQEGLIWKATISGMCMNRRKKQVSVSM
jgi:hypothetical protein